MSALTTEKCACPNCVCSADPQKALEHNGKLWCSEACAHLHPGGAPCPTKGCQCGTGTQTQNRLVSDSQLDQAVEETFPASDPISP